MVLDVKSTFDALVTRYTPDAAARERILGNRFYRQISAALAGSHEYMAMEKLLELHADERFDLVVLDTPPTRHALDFLEAPDRLLDVLDTSVLRWFLRPYFVAGRLTVRVATRTGAVALRLADRFLGLQFLQDLSEFFLAFESMYDGFKERATKVHALLREPSSGFVMVAGPQPLALEEALYFHRRLDEKGMPFVGFVVNRVHTDPAREVRSRGRGRADVALALAARLAETLREQQVLARVERRAVARLEVDTRERPVLVPELEHDVHDLRGLAEFGDLRVLPRASAPGASGGAVSVRLVLYSGKGGVGKTSLSAATAIRAAKLGHRTLVVSTDSAHSLADALDRKVGPEPTAILPGLDAVEVDVNQELSSHWGTIHEYLTRFMTFRGVDETVAEEIAILPGMEELFSLVRVKAWSDSRRWDFIVIDCAPTGDTVRMLAVPEVLGFYFSRIFPIQRTVVRTVRPVAQRMTDMPIPSDDVFGAIKRVYDQIEGMGPLLQDPKRSSIRIVLNPERMVINESQRLYTYLSLFGFPVDAVVANRVLPEEARSKYFDRWLSIQKGHLATARTNFDPLPFFEAPLFDREMVGTEMLDQFGKRVFGKTDPAAVLHRDKPVEVKKEGRIYALYMRLPFAEKDRIQVFSRGDELVVQVDNQRRHLVLPRTLAGRSVASAGFVDQRLRVTFGEKEAS